LDSRKDAVRSSPAAYKKWIPVQPRLPSLASQFTLFTGMTPFDRFWVLFYSQLATRNPLPLQEIAELSEKLSILIPSPQPSP